MSQAQTLLPTVGTISGVAEQGLINGLAAALRSKFSGGSVPSAAGSPDGFQDWMDTSVSGQATWKLYLAATTSWLALMTIDTATGAISLNAASTQNWVAASGTHDAITAAYDPPVTLLIDGMVLFFRATAANLLGGGTTFSPNGLTAHPVTKNGGQNLWPGDIPGAGAEVALRYNLASTRWELLNPPDVPIGGIVPYFGSTIPPGFVLPQGQNLSATTYPAANAVLSTTYGNPGGGNFTMPDMRGRFFFNLDAGGSNRITVAGGNFDGSTLGSTGGGQNKTITQANLPSINFNVTDAGHTHATNVHNANGNFGNPAGHYPGLNTNGGNGYSGTADGVNGFAADFNKTTTTGITVASGGSGTALAVIPPSMGVNCMMRIA